MFENKTILITGGTGSLGKKLTERLLKQNPKKIIIYSRDELKQSEMKKKYPDKDIRYFIGNVRDRDRLKRAMEGVDFVIHTAALKQVDTLEYNPFEAVQTNIIGAKNVIECAIDNKVKKVVALSTDKACQPINLYGFTKGVNDKLFQHANVYAKDHDIKMAVVRYGNVAGSRGSVIPFFKNMKKSGAEFLPVTDPEMTRFYITLNQAVDLIFTAFSEMKGGEIFVSKLPSFKITDLVEAFEMGAVVTGIRPGEKLHEQMISIYDKYDEYKDYFVIHANGEKTGLDYNSKNNDYMTIQELREMIK